VKIVNSAALKLLAAAVNNVLAVAIIKKDKLIIGYKSLKPLNKKPLEKGVFNF
jgi:hypothetical protein